MRLCFYPTDRELQKLHENLIEAIKRIPDTQVDFNHMCGKKNNDVCYIITRGSSLETLKMEMSLCEVRCANSTAVKLQRKEDSSGSKNKQPSRYGWVVYLKVRPERLELPTFCSEDKRSVQLSYGRRSERNYSPKNNEPTVLKLFGCG